MYRIGLFLLLCHGLYAVTPPCLFDFASVADGDPDGVVITGITYDRFFDSLGGKINQATLEKMVAGKDPFTVPEQANTDLFALRTNLKELKRMLVERGWYHPDTNPQLLAQLKTRADALGGQAVKSGIAVQANRKDLVFEGTAHKPTHAMSPDGRWFVMLPSVGEFTSFLENTDVPVVITDLHTGVTTQTRNTKKEATTGRLTFGPDGKSLVFFTNNYSTLTVPFENGVLNWAAQQHRTYPKVDQGISIPRPGENDNYAYGGNPEHFQRINLTTNVVDRVYPSEEATKGHAYPNVVRSGSVGKTESAYTVVTNNRHAGRLLVYDSGPDGKLTSHHRVLAEWSDKNPLQAHAWTPEGKLITLNGGKFLEWPRPTQPKELMAVKGTPPHAGIPEAARWDVKTHPTGALILYSDNRKTRWVEVYDFTQNQLVTTLFLPNDTAVVSLSPDGQRLIAKTGNDVHVINYRKGEETK